MQELQRSKGAISALLAGEDFSGALDIVGSAQKLLKEGDFQQLHCMSGLSKNLDDYSGLVGDLLSSRFASFALEGVGRSVAGEIGPEVRESVNAKGGDGWQQLKEPFDESQREDLLKVGGWWRSLGHFCLTSWPMTDCYYYYSHV